MIYNKSMEKYPEIIIQYGRLIDPVFTFYCQNNPELKKFGWNKWVPPTKEELEKRVESYKEEWARYNMVQGISSVFGISFKRDVIDVFIVSGISRACSNPIIIKSGFKPKEFVVTLTHELIHRILTENKIPRVVYDENESDTTNNHVIVYAVLKKILSEELWNIAIQPRSKSPSPDYVKALEISEKMGPDNAILQMMKAVS